MGGRKDDLTDFHKVTINIDDEEPDFLQKLKAVLKLCDKEIKLLKTKKLTTECPLIQSGGVIDFLRGCIISHRYRQAAQILEIMTFHVKPPQRGVFYKCAIHVLERLSEKSKEDTLAYFVRHSACLSVINKREIVLEYLIFILRRGNFELPRHIIQTLLKKTLILRKHRTLDPLFKAYLALFDYIAWAKEAHSSIDGHQKEEVKVLREKTVSTLSEVIATQGVWDVFVVKVVEMLTLPEDNLRCQLILRNYMEANQNHLNAYVYLEIYKPMPDFVGRKENLEKIADMSPSDPLVLDYVDILQFDEDLAKALRRIFLFMDYSINKENVLGWNKLAHIVCDIHERQDPKSLRVFKKMWKHRKSYWPQYHFDADYVFIDNKEQAKVCTEKCIFYYIVLKFSDDNEYIQAVREQLKNSFPKQFKRFQRRMDKISS